MCKSVLYIQSLRGDLQAEDQVRVLCPSDTQVNPQREHVQVSTSQYDMHPDSRTSSPTGPVQHEKDQGETKRQPSRFGGIVREFLDAGRVREYDVPSLCDTTHYRPPAMRQPITMTLAGWARAGCRSCESRGL
jgi:hypothetical protein